MNFSRNNKGFTLIEMLIALSIFILVMLAGVNVYFVISTAQHRTVALQKVQDDVRYLYEAMAQEIRLGTINYTFYDTENISLHPNISGDGITSILALQDQLHVPVYYRLQGTAVQYCRVDDSASIDCDLTDHDQWQNVTPSGVEVTSLGFFITPSADPFVNAGEAVDCSSGGQADCDVSYRCDAGATNTCLYYSDGNNFQPKVQMQLTARALDSRIPEESRTLHFQTMVSSRIFQGQIQNNNYE